MDYKQDIKGKIPDWFVDFVNTREIWNFDEQGKLPNMEIHAMLRILDRYGTDESTTEQDFLDGTVRQRVQGVLNAVYNTLPEEIRIETDQKICTKTLYNNQAVKTIFAQSGKLITIYPPKPDYYVL